MKKTRIIVDGFFILISTYFLIFCIFRLINTPKILSHCVSFILSFCAIVFYFIKSCDFNDKISLSKLEKKQVLALKNKLAIMSNSEIIDLFASFLPNFENKGFYLESQNEIIVLQFLHENVSANQGLTLLKKITAKKQILYLANGFSPELLQLLKPINIKTFSIKNVFLLIKEKKPKFIESLTIEKSIKFDFSVFFAKRSGARFIIYGILLLAFSLVTFFPFYYVLSGGIFIVYGVIALFFGKSQKTADENNLLNFLQN